MAGKAVALQVDVNALPIHDDTAASFKSKSVGVICM